MKTKILTILFLAFAQFAFTQEDPMSYEWFEKQSKIISDLQYKTSGQNGRNYAKDNFTVYYNDKKASYSYTHTVNNTEYTTVIEDVDFSKATGLDTEDNIVYVAFPDHSITEQVYGGKEYQYVKTGLLAFYPNSKDDRAKMLFELYHIITELKIDKALITRTDAIKQWKDYKALKPYEFYKKHPQSVLAYEGKLLEEDYKRQVKFVNKLAEQYKVPVMGKTSASEFSNNEVMRYYKKSRNTYGGEALIPIKKKIEEGKNFISMIVTGKGREYDDEIQLFGYTVIIDKDYNLVKQKYNELKNELKNNLDAEFISEQKENSIRFYLLREGKVGKDITSKSAKNISSIEIFFHEYTYKKEKWYELYVQY